MPWITVKVCALFVRLERSIFLLDISPNVGLNMILFYEQKLQHDGWYLQHLPSLLWSVTLILVGRKFHVIYPNFRHSYFCHIFVMCSFNTWRKLSAKYWSKSSWCSYTFFRIWSRCSFPCWPTLLHREEPLIHVLLNQPSELFRAIIMKFLKQSVVSEKTGRSMLSLEVNNADNTLKHDREMEIGEPTSRILLKRLRQKQQKIFIMDMCSLYRTATRYLTRHLPLANDLLHDLVVPHPCLSSNTQNCKETITDNQTGLCMPNNWWIGDIPRAGDPRGLVDHSKRWIQHIPKVDHYWQRVSET